MLSMPHHRLCFLLACHLAPSTSHCLTLSFDLTCLQAQKGTGDNHAVSAMKFGILRRFVELGWAVLLADVDIAVLQVRAYVAVQS